MTYSHRSYQPARHYWDICKSKVKMLPQTVFQLQKCPQHLLCDLPTYNVLLHRGKKGVNTTSEETFPSGDDGRGLHSWRLLVLTVLLPLQLFWKHLLLEMVKMVHGPYVQTLSPTSVYLLLHTTAATRVARAYVRRKIQTRQDRSQRCHQLCPIFTAQLDPAADKKDFLCSSDTKVTSWTQLTDFQNFQIFIPIYRKTILNNRPD